MPKKTNKKAKTKIEAALYLVPTSRPFPIFRVRDAKVRGRASCAREWWFLHMQKVACPTLESQ
jgi:hypothetical protein